MQKGFSIIMLLGLVGLIIGSSSEMSVTSKDHKINVRGTLSILANPEEVKDVENIAIGGLTEGIVFYPKPERLGKQGERELAKNPEQGVKDYLDFVRDIEAITVPNPVDVWVYEEVKHKSITKTTRYIVVDVLLKNGKTENYLMNTARIITCRTVDGDVVREKDVPLTELNKLTITSAVLKDEKQTRNNKGEKPTRNQKK